MICDVPPHVNKVIDVINKLGFENKYQLGGLLKTDVTCPSKGLPRTVLDPLILYY